MFATFNSKTRNQDPITASYKKALSAVDIAAMKINIEANYKVAFIYSGREYDYDVSLTGAIGEFTRAINTLFPKGRSDIIIQRSQY